MLVSAMALEKKPTKTIRRSTSKAARSSRTQGATPPAKQLELPVIEPARLHTEISRTLKHLLEDAARERRRYKLPLDTLGKITEDMGWDWIEKHGLGIRPNGEGRS